MIATIGLFLFYSGLTIIVLYIFIAQCYIVNMLANNKKDMAAMIKVTADLANKIAGLSATTTSTTRGLSVKLGQGAESLGLVVTATTNLLERQEKLEGTIESIVKDLIEAHNTNTLTVVDALDRLRSSNNSNYTH
jgi:hypothetical protein